MESLLKEFYEARKFFVENDVMSKVAAPRQHALSHYIQGIRLYGALNGLCSSITESKHIESVKKPWRASSRNAPIGEMMLRISRLEKLAGLKAYLTSLQLIWGTTSQFMQAWLAQLYNDNDEATLAADCDVASDVASDADSADSYIHIPAGRTHIPAAEKDDAAPVEESLDEAQITTITSSVILSRRYGE
jgi:hypothetical protein